MVFLNEGIVPNHLYYPSPCQYKDPIITTTTVLPVWLACSRSLAEDHIGFYFGD